jgi:hypothetical protein
MNKFFFLVLIIFPFFTLAQKNINLGQGMLNIDFEKLPTIGFYSDTMQKSPAKTVTVTKDKHGEHFLKNQEQVLTWFKPEGFWLDYSIFVIRVDTIAGKWYRVYINNDKGLTMWTKADAVKKFVQWSTFLIRETTAIDKIPDFELDIKVAPDVKAKTIKRMETTDCFEALEIKGDWLRIKTNETLDCNESKKTIKSGWIKWRIKNRLTIGYGLTC